MQTGTSFIDVNAPVGEEQLRAIRRLDNNALIIRLHFTINHLSRWLSPIHDRNKLERARFRGEPTAKEIVLGMREEEQRVYPKMYAIANQNNPDLDKLPPYHPSFTRQQSDEEHSTIVLMASFRRLRQSTCSLLRSLPDDAWRRKGISRRERDVTLRELAEELVAHDYRFLHALDQTLDAAGAREGLAAIQKTPLDELLKLVPERLTV
jgi:hypothetical protein